MTALGLSSEMMKQMQKQKLKTPPKQTELSRKQLLDLLNTQNMNQLNLPVTQTLGANG